MSVESLGKSWVMNFITRPAGAMMGSRLRAWLRDPVNQLQGADIGPGQTVLEVGSGTGFFTIPAAKMIGDSGHLIAMEPLARFAETVRDKVARAGLGNVVVIQRDALDTRLETASMDTVLLFGVVPFPTLPLNKLLPEMHRVLKDDGKLAIWLFPTSAGVPTAVNRSGLFRNPEKKNGIYSWTKAASSPQ